MKRALIPVLLALLGTATTAQAGAPGEVAVGQVLGEAVLQGLNGPARALSTYRGRPLIINVWASWCGPCRAEMASLERLAWRGLKPEFAIIGISTDDDRDAARAFLQQANATITQYLDDRLQMEHMLGATHLPLTLLVDANGRVLSKTFGSRDWDSPETREMIRKAFAARSVRGP